MFDWNGNLLWEVYSNDEHRNYLPFEKNYKIETLAGRDPNLFLEGIMNKMEELNKRL